MDPAEMNDTMLIIGAGLAGATAAATLREEGFTGPVVLVGDEDQVPYIRPPLSKGFLAGKDSEDSLLPYPGDWYKQNDVELITGQSVTAIDPAAHTVTLADGETRSYAKLLLATGASPRVIPFPGVELKGVHYFRTKADSDRLRAELSGGGRRLVLIGSGWIGMEIAATARELGNEVTLLGLEEIPLSRRHRARDRRGVRRPPPRGRRAVRAARLRQGDPGRRRRQRDRRRHHHRRNPACRPGGGRRRRRPEHRAGRSRRA